MEKLKRQPQPRPFFSILVFAAIFVVGFALGIIALNAFQVTQNSSNQILLAENTSNCAPVSRQYSDPVADSYEGDGAVQGGVAASGQGGGSIAMSSTGTAMSNPQTGQNANAPVGTSVVLMNATPYPNTAQLMTIPGTYTPMPTMPIGGQNENVLLVGTPAPQGNTTNQTQPVRMNPLSAGEIDDNAEWDVYLTYRENFREAGSLYNPIDDVDVSNRQIIRVINPEGQAILGALVEVLSPDGMVIQSSCTYATGLTQFFPQLDNASYQQETFGLRVSKDGVVAETQFNLSAEPVTVELAAQQGVAKLDLLFLIDATGSMDDEIAQITNNIVYISQQIDALPDEVDVRYGLVSFKDPSYPTQVWDFTSDVQLFQSQLATLYTAGGAGETLNDGLDRSLHAVNWRGDDTVKLVFLIGDEPPAVYPQHPSYADSMLQALYSGIKIHPIASSGLDVQGEYIFRQIAQASMGHFIFLSYENGATAVQPSDTGGAVDGSVAEEPSGQYNVSQLHEIVLNLIREELGFNEGQQ